MISVVCKAQANRRVRPFLITLASLLALSMLVAGRAAAGAGAPTLNASLSVAELTYGSALAVSGQVLDAGGGLQEAPLALQADPYPFRGFVTVARLRTAADGSFVFSGVRPNRNTRLRVIDEGPPAATSAVLPVIVDPAAAINAASVGRGRTRLSLRVEHTREGASTPVSAWWFLARGATGAFHLAAVTPTRELSPGVTYASVTIDPPSRRFSYRVCFNPTWEHAMGAPASHRPCPEGDSAAQSDVG